MIEEFSRSHDTDSTEGLEGLKVFFVAGHKEICVRSQGAFQDSVVWIVRKNA